MSVQVRFPLLMTHNLGHDHEPEIIDQTSEGTRTVWLTRSEDERTHLVCSCGDHGHDQAT